MKRSKLTVAEFEKLFESIKEDVFSEKLSKSKEKKITSFIDKNLNDDPTMLNYLLLRLLAKIDKRIDISIEVAEMYSFSTTYCIAKKLNYSEKEMTVLYDEIDREMKLMVEKAVSAKEEMKYITKMLAAKYKATDPRE
jgi:hypothetical protein